MIINRIDGFRWIHTEGIWDISHNALICYIEEVFSKEFGDDILGVIDLSMLPHEAFIQVGVTSVKPKMKEFAKAIEKEFDELGRRISIDVIGK